MHLIALVTVKAVLAKPFGLTPELNQASDGMRFQGEPQPAKGGGRYAPAGPIISGHEPVTSRLPSMERCGGIFLKGGLEGKSLNWVAAERIRFL